MKIKMKSRYAGPSGCHQPGDVVDMEDRQAKNLVQAGFAEAIDPVPSTPEPPASIEDAEPEVAALDTAETTTKKTARRKSRARRST